LKENIILNLCKQKYENVINMKKFKISVNGSEKVVFQKIREAASKKEAWRMSEKEVISAINKLFVDTGKYSVNVTIKEARKIGGFPKRMIGV
jgi:hypothetical protein